MQCTRAATGRAEGCIALVFSRISVGVRFVESALGWTAIIRTLRIPLRLPPAPKPGLNARQMVIP